jgi:hypothetical protein
MATEAQIAANRLNAQKSTGPRTVEGKAKISRSAFHHGMTAASQVLFDESEAEFEEFHAGLSLDLEPVGTAECALVERIAILAWRLRRASRAEAALVNAEAERRKERAAAEPDKGAIRIDASLIFDRLTSGMNALTRYETAIERQMNRTIKLLGRWQERRRERQEEEFEEMGYGDELVVRSAYTGEPIRVPIVKK